MDYHYSIQRILHVEIQLLVIFVLTMMLKIKEIFFLRNKFIVIIDVLIENLDMNMAIRVKQIKMKKISNERDEESN